MTRHAPQARFDRMAQVGLHASACTTEQMHNWTETDWNWHFREALQTQGFRCFHIREASETGIADLIVYRKIQVTGIKTAEFTDLQVIEAWIELKVENDKVRYERDPRKASQRQFMRDHWRSNRNAIYVMYDRTVQMLAVHQGDLKGRVKMIPQSPYATPWQGVFDHFKSRRVSV